MSDQREIEALLEAHELIIVEREDARREMEPNEFTEGHMNGLSEARNRVEQAILERVNNLECHKNAHMKHVAEDVDDAP